MGTPLQINTDRLIKDLRHLATFGRTGNGVNRRSLTESDLASRYWLCERMQEAGMEAGIDGIGSVFGKTPHSRRILIGSHTDTVPNGGWLDGALGVIYGLEIGHAMMEQAGDHDIGIEVISFVDEEARFTPMFGSQVFCGEISEDRFGELISADGVTFAEARSLANLCDIPIQRLDPDCHLAYLEAHIEQGPILESSNTKIGAVTGIIGASHFRIRFRGQANHAGTMPMSMRKDAAVAMFDFVQRFTAFCQADAGADTVWTYSEVRTEPKAGNVISNFAECSVGYRDTSSEILARFDEGLERMCREAASASGVKITKEKTVTLTPTILEERIVNEVNSAADEYGVIARRMPSGAGHDAMILGRYIPAGMLFRVHSKCQ